MRHTIKPGLFPWLSIFTGTIGFALQCWLFSSKASNGLLPAHHIANTLTFLLFALTLTECILLLRSSKPNTHYETQFPRSVLAGIGSFVGALALVCSAFTQEYVAAARFVLPLLGVIAAGALLFRGYCRIAGLRPHFLFSCAVIVYLILWLVTRCREWCIQPQLQYQVFQVFFAAFLLLTAYYRVELELDVGNCRRYTFFSQATLFCACVCIPSGNSLFYLLAAIWVAADCCTLRR